MRTALIIVIITAIVGVVVGNAAKKAVDQALIVHLSESKHG